MLNLPKSWGDGIDVDKYKELVNLNIEDFKSVYHYKLELIAILLETSSDDPIFDDLDIFEIEELLDGIKWLFNEPSYSYKKEIENLKVKNLRNLSLGEFIDLEGLFKNYKNNIEKIFATIYKQYKVDEWGNSIEEPYIYNIEERSEKFKYLPINSVYGTLKYYTDWKKNFMDRYRSLFQEDDFDVIEDEEQLSPEELEEIKRDIEKEKKLSKFSWHLLIYKLCNGDLTKMDDVTNLNVNFVFNQLLTKKNLDLQ